MNEPHRLGQLGVLIYLLRSVKRRGFEANLVAEVCRPAVSLSSDFIYLIFFKNKINK